MTGCYSADPRPALLGTEHAEHCAAADDHGVGSDLADGRRAPDVALGLIGLALVDALAGGSQVGKDARARLGALLAILGGGPADGSAIGLAAAGDVHNDAALGVRPFALDRLCECRRWCAKRHRSGCNAQEKLFHSVHLATVCGKNRALSLREDERPRLVGPGDRPIGARPDLGFAQQAAERAAGQLQPVEIERLKPPADVHVLVGNVDLALPDATGILVEAREKLSADEAVHARPGVEFRSIRRPRHRAAIGIAATVDSDDDRSIGMQPIALYGLTRSARRERHGG